MPDIRGFTAEFQGNDPSVAIRSVFLVLGVLALGLGLGIYQSARLGCGPTDGFNQIVSERLKIPLKWERVGCDVIMTVLGWNGRKRKMLKGE